MKNEKLKIIFYPQDKNPYQYLLSTEIEKNTNSKITYINKSVIYSLFINRFKGNSIFHLHWLYPFQIRILRNFNTLYLITSSIYLFIVIILIKLLKYRLVYTLHNDMSHEKQFIDEKYATQFVINMSDSIIVHSNESIKLLKYRINNEKIKIIPHGNYIDYYENKISRQYARKKFNISNKDIVYLFFGSIKKYKGIENLLAAFEKLINNESTSNAKLIIAGEPQDKNYHILLNKYKYILKEKIIINSNHIADKDIQKYMNASDIVVFPFNKITTSGSVILALSFKKVILAPNIGNIVDLPNNIVYKYNTEENDGLYNALQKAYFEKSDLVRKGNKGFKYIEKVDWSNISMQTYITYLG